MLCILSMPYPKGYLRPKKYGGWFSSHNVKVARLRSGIILVRGFFWDEGLKRPRSPVGLALAAPVKTEEFFSVPKD